MAINEKGGKKSQHSSKRIKAEFRRFQIGVLRFYRELAPGMRWVLLLLASIALLSSAILFSSGYFSSPSKNQLSKEKIIAEASIRLRRLGDALIHVRDSVAKDTNFTGEILEDAPQTALFETIQKLDSSEDSRFSDILPPSLTEKYSFLNGRGIGFYNKQLRLTAWNSTKTGMANFDSVFSLAPMLEKRSNAIILQSEQMYFWIVGLRKIISKEGSLLGYVIVKQMIGERFPLGGSEEHPISIFEDIITNSGRDISFSFPPLLDTSGAKNIYPVYLDPSDSTSIAGYMTIGETPAAQSSALQKTLRYVRDFAFVLFIIILTWLACWRIAERASFNQKYSLKILSIAGIFLLFILARILLLTTNALAVIIPQPLQDPRDFSLPDGYGLLSDPLQLFTSIFFITSFFSLIWVVYVPKKAGWRTSSHSETEEDLFSTTGWLMKIVSIICLILVLPLLNYVFASVINVLVENGSYHFLDNRFGFSRGSFILMEASFLLTGVAYFFCTIMLLQWILRSMIRITASELSPTRSYLAHYILFIIIITLTGWLLSPNVLYIYPEIYWVILSMMLSLVTVIIFSRDVSAIRTGEKSDSYFYRTPRSGLALLFLLTASGFLLSPLIATQEYTTDLQIVEQNLRQNSQENDLSYTSFLDQTFILLTNDGGKALSLSTSSDITNLAFNIWLKQFPNDVNRNIIIEVQDEHGKTLSHFAQNASIEDEMRIAISKDSLIGLLRSTGNKNTPTQSYIVSSIPCFTVSCTPAFTGVGLLTLQVPQEENSHESYTNVKEKFIISISFWTDIFPQSRTHSLYDIVRSPGSSVDKLSPNYNDYFFSEYRNGTLLSANTSVIEFPSHISPLIDTTLQSKEFVSLEGHTEGNRSYTLFHRFGERGNNSGRIMAATIIIPGVKSLIQLALSLNTVSLFIGFFVIFIALVIRSLFSKGKRGTLKFRDRIFLIVLTIALVPLVIVTNITRTLLIEREQNIERDNLQRDAGVIAERLQRTFAKTDSLSKDKLNASLSDLSYTIGRDISFYTKRGILIATNRPELYESSLLPSQLSSETFRKIFSGEKSFTIEPLSSGDGSFDIGYQTVLNSTDKSINGVIGITSFRGVRIIEADIAQTIELMYGAFAALGIILLLIGAWISVRVATPIQQLIAATERVTQGRLETFVNIKRKDEVGELAQAFNRMTKELERTRENVAQSEREGAWKEMARQVAHEIKNPLTPMKLSVQHVSHSYEAGDSNFGSIFRRVIRTLSEQIDVLTRIATEFSRFGEMPRRKYGFVSLRKIAESAVALYDAERVRIRFVIDIPNNLPPIYADDEEFRRALVNLIRNSLQATEGWGIILIQAKERNGLIHLDFKDTGSGMSEETLKKAFDPNFSTKTSGMGLGLAIVKKIITDMSGTISVESKLGKGTIFHLELPAREYPAE